MSRLLIDIGSTYFKVAQDGQIDQYFRNFETSILSDLESKCASSLAKYSKEDTYICSSANGGLTTLIIGLTNSFSLKYAVNIAMHYRDATGQGHGGHVIYAIFEDYTKTMKSDVYTKLWAETEITIEIAKLIGDIGIKPVIHLDYNSDENEYSHVLYNAGIGFAISEGFEAQGKPYAWTASHTADKIAKKKTGKR